MGSSNSSALVWDLRQSQVSLQCLWGATLRPSGEGRPRDGRATGAPRHPSGQTAIGKSLTSPSIFLSQYDKRQGFKTHKLPRQGLQWSSKRTPGAPRAENLRPQKSCEGGKHTPSVTCYPENRFPKRRPRSFSNYDLRKTEEFQNPKTHSHACLRASVLPPRGDERPSWQARAPSTEHSWHGHHPGHRAHT